MTEIDQKKEVEVTELFRSFFGGSRQRESRRIWVRIGSGISQGDDGYGEDFEVWWSTQGTIRVYNDARVARTSLQESRGDLHTSEEIILSWQHAFIDEQRRLIESLAQVLKAVSEVQQN